MIPCPMHETGPARPPACMHVHVPMQTRSRKSRIIFSRFLSDVQRPPTDNRRAFRKMGGKEQKKKNEKNENVEEENERGIK